MKEYLVQERAHPVGVGVQKQYRFPNGYGASVVKFTIGGLPGSYGAEDGLWELAVVKWTSDKTYELDYTTGIIEDVLGRLTEADVESTLQQIKNLKGDKA